MAYEYEGRNYSTTSSYEQVRGSYTGVATPACCTVVRGAATTGVRGTTTVEQG